MPAISLAAALSATGLATPGVASAAEPDGAWVATGSMSTARNHHDATKLLDGRVLVVATADLTFGGHSAEIYSPSTGSWAPVEGAPGFYDQTLTTLDDGRVLVAGGRVAIATTRSSLFDPTTETTTEAGFMHVRRANHAAVKLDDGRVLVAGGEGDSRGPGQGSAYTAEVYDPSTGTWTATAPMNAARSRPTAALLPDGRALVVGGDSAEVYDPVTDSWTPTGPLPNATGGLNHAMTTLADGRVLSVGGSAGIDGVRDAAIYDVATNTWTAVSPMIDGRSFHTATTLADGRVVVAGAHQVETNWRSEIYDPATDTWSQGPDLSRRRDLHTATLLDDGRVLVAGSALATADDKRSAELFDPAATPPAPTQWNVTVETFTMSGINHATVTWNAQPNTELYSTSFDSGLTSKFIGWRTSTSFTYSTGQSGPQTGTFTICGNQPECGTVEATW